MNVTFFTSCCNFGEMMDLSKAEIPEFLVNLVDLTDQNLWISVFFILFNPFFWNVVARLEHNTRFLSRLCRSAHFACVLLAGTIFYLMLLRGRRFQLVISTQPVISDCTPVLGSYIMDWVGFSLVQFGLVLALSSFWALGFFGTYLGDYFGILMEKKVTGFPFNLTAHPMYYGSFLEYLGIAIWYKSPVGICLSFLLLIAYKVAILFEEPFTDRIYRERDAKREAKKLK